MKWQYRWTSGSVEPTLWYDFDEQKHLEFSPSPGRNLEWRQVPKTKYVFKVGDTIADAEILDRLPVKAGVLDSDRDIWQKSSLHPVDRYRPWSWGNIRNSSQSLLNSNDSVEVIYLPKGYPDE